MKELKLNKFNGFTLLELLVVIGIISILMAIGVVSYGAAQAKGRDSRRISDVKSIQSGLEQYYTDHNFKYPDDDCSLIVGDYIRQMPQDPINGVVSGSSYVYPVGGCTVADYCYCVLLEKPAGNAGAADCSGWASGGNYYCVTNLQ